MSGLSCGVLAALWIFHAARLPASTPLFVMAALIVTAVSWIDDLRPLEWYPRLIAHGIAAAILLWAAGAWRVIDLPVAGEVQLGWLGLPLTFVWVVGFTNAFNFMDGIDGIAGGQALVAGASWLLISGFSVPLAGWVALLVAATNLGFLVHNRHPARILMGDAGSIFVGFSLATLGVLGASEDPRIPMVAVLLLWPFVFDTCFTFLRRLSKGENVLRPHRSHLYQRLVAAGYGHSQVSLLYSGLAAFGSLLGVVWMSLGHRSALVTAGLAAGAAFLWTVTVSAERHARRAVTELERLAGRRG